MAKQRLHFPYFNYYLTEIEQSENNRVNATPQNMAAKEREREEKVNRGMKLEKIKL